MDGTGGHYVKKGKPDTERQVMQFSLKCGNLKRRRKKATLK
jgi:hypothetical protein